MKAETKRYAPALTALALALGAWLGAAGAVIARTAGADSNATEGLGERVSATGLSVYPPVPGLDPSPHYRFRVRRVGSDEWLEPFALMTRCADYVPRQSPQGYYSGAVGGWSQTYCNFEMGEGVPVEVEITRLDPATGEQRDIRTAVPHPRRKVRSWRVENGRVHVIFENPALFAVDIDGQMDDLPLPRNPPSRQRFINENAIHTVTVFANPFITDKPDPTDPAVHVVEPGEQPPTDGDWTTVYFNPGVHQLWEGEWSKGDQYYILDGRNYYIPGDAVVHGTFAFHGGQNTIRVFGHGTLTQERITHALHQDPPLEGRDRGLTSALKVGNAVGTQVEGITITDSPDHAVWINGSFNPDPATFNHVRWVKVVTWRANGDGITVGDNDFLEDSFMRVQDDGTYLKGRGVRRVVYWTDCNGTALKTNMITRMSPDNYADQDFVVEDIDIIYGRSSWPGEFTHTVLGGNDNFDPRRGRDGTINQGSHIVFRNINFEDPIPLRKLISFAVGGSRPKDLVGIRFENVRAAAPSLYGYQNDFRGKPDRFLRDFVLDNLVVGGRQICGADDLDIDEFVTGMVFKNTEPMVNTFLNHSGYNKWYMREDWSAAVEPADHDLVRHTAQAGTLIVDCPAWAGSLQVAHAEKAVIRLEFSGRLAITDTLTLGDAQGARGELHLTDGDVVLRNASADALELPNGTVHLEGNGTLLWAGDRVDDAATLLAEGRITLGRGRTDIPQAAPYDRVRRLIEEQRIKAEGGEPEEPGAPEPVLVGQADGHGLFADFNRINPGFTTFWAAPPEAPTSSGEGE